MTREVTRLKTAEKSDFSAAAEARRKRIAREMMIPELYRRPMGCRELHGCLKARA
jgi:hypothetical protein